jgi:hypothetical protein
MVTTAISTLTSLIRPVAKVEGADLSWGTYGKGRIHPLKEVKLGDCETDHLQAILRTESWHLTVQYDQAIRRILQSRGVEPLPYSQCRTRL